MTKGEILLALASEEGKREVAVRVLEDMRGHHDQLLVEGDEEGAARAAALQAKAEGYRDSAVRARVELEAALNPPKVELVAEPVE